MESLKGFVEGICLKENFKKLSLVKKNLHGVRTDLHQDERLGKKLQFSGRSWILVHVFSAQSLRA